MLPRSRLAALAALVVFVSTSNAFQLPHRSLKISQSSLSPPWTVLKPATVVLSAQAPRELGPDDNEAAAVPRKQLPRLLQRLVRRMRNVPMALAIVTASLGLLHRPPAAHASAPVMAMPKAEQRDPATDAIMEHERRMQVKTQRELQAMAAKAREIEATQGEAARVKFEHDYKARQVTEAAERAAGLIELKRSLLKQGICPFTDIEGRRQMILYEHGVDLGEIPGTTYHLEKTLESKTPKRSSLVKKAAHRQLLACIVEDLENRGLDPLEYFERHQERTMAIMDIPEVKASALVGLYRANLEKYGQITPPKEGELSVKEKLAAAAVVTPQSAKAAKEEAKRVKAEQAAKEKVEREQAKAEAKAAKEAANAQAKAAKEAAQAEAKAAKEAEKAKAQAKKEADAASRALAAGTAAAAANVDTLAAEEQSISQSELDDFEDDVDDDVLTEVEPAPRATSLSKKSSKSLPIVPIIKVATAFVAVGGGTFAFKMYRDKAAQDEAERQRQFKLLMEGFDGSGSAPALEVIEEEDKTAEKPKLNDAKKAAASPASTAESLAPKKKKLGITKVFGKKKNERETDLRALVSADAKAPEFATVLAKILTYGAPGRFPDVVKLPGGMPMATFDLETAKKTLVKQQEESGLTLEESAEIFANVVNCMLIDIVDLASAALKENKDDVTVNAINIVVDFMNHAASLYDSIAKDVVIKPVTYAGDLSKSKLEQMYGTYAVSGMMGMFGGGANGTTSGSEDFDNRVALLQDVFQISEKKAEGLMMKAVQKNMMEMMKDGKGMEGMEKMLGGMGGLEGGLPGMDGEEGPSPEQLKEMLIGLKEMKESGSIPPSEFETVKKQFKDAFGASLDDVVKDASSDGQLSESEKELLGLMKAIMED